MSIYNNLEKNNDILQNIDPRFVVNFINGPYLEVSNSIGNNYDVSFIDKQTGIVHYSTNISNNCWTRSNISYFVDWKIIAKRNDGEVFEFDFDAKDKRVFIALESKSLGDTMAWFPYVDEFRKKWNCSVICSTFHNNLFIDQYPELEFVSPGSAVNGIYAMYKIGLFFDGDDINYKLHKVDPKGISLLGIATDILGLEYSEIRPRLKSSNIEKKKRVGIGFHSTAQTKYWNNPTGWQEVTDFLISNGYEVVIASKEEDGYMGNFYPNGATRIPEGNIESLIDELNSCEFFIGISSGLSWLAWAINIPVVIISGFTDENLEPSDNIVRIIEKSVCNGCWSRHKFNAGDWNWCPDNKGTERQFECTKSITGEMVINELLENNLVKKDLTIIFYTDKNYEYMASGLIESIKINSDVNTRMVYYTIGFESDLNEFNLIKKVYPIDQNKKSFEFYKPSIMLDAIDTFGTGDYLFLDSDILVGKNFSIDKIKNNNDYPIFPIGVWEYPFFFINDVVFNEIELMKYMGVEKRSMIYVYSCLCSFNERCRDTILEWKSVCDNQFLMNDMTTYFPFKDETPINVILWRRDIDKNLGKIFLNTHEYDKIVLSEESKLDIETRLNCLDEVEEFVLDEVIFYHGVKDKDELVKTIEYFKNKKESN